MSATTLTLPAALLALPADALAAVGDALAAAEERGRQEERARVLQACDAEAARYPAGFGLHGAVVSLRARIEGVTECVG